MELSTLPSDGQRESRELQSNRNGNVDSESSFPSPREEYPTGLRFILITVALILSIFLSALDSSILSTAIPKITDQFGTIKDVGWYSTAYTITNTAFGTAWGKAYKYFPLKTVFLLAVAVFEVGNVICALAPSSPVLILGRLVAGTGGGGVMTGCFIIIAMSAKPQYRAAYMGTLGVTFACASIAGPLFGGFLTDGPGWRWCFWISLPIGVIAVGMMMVSFQTPTAARPMPCPLKEKIIGLDMGGACLALGSLTCLVMGLERGGTVSSWSNWRVVTSLCASAGLCICFILNEHFMGSRAMVQGHLLKRRIITTNLVYQFFLAGLFFPLSYTLPIQFQSVDNASATQSGVRLIPLILGVCVFTMVANGLLTFWRHFTPFLVFGAIIGTIGVTMVHTLGADTRLDSWIGYEILVGLGVGTALQVTMIANQTVVGIEDMAAVTSLTLFVENLGTVIFTASTQAALFNGLINALTSHSPNLKPELVINAGATRIRETFKPDEVHGILSSYLQGCKESHFVPIACGICTILVSILIAFPVAVKKLESGIRKRS